jgi:hypothetical protein
MDQAYDGMIYRFDEYVDDIIQSQADEEEDIVAALNRALVDHKPIDSVLYQLRIPFLNGISVDPTTFAVSFDATAAKFSEYNKIFDEFKYDVDIGDYQSMIEEYKMAYIKFYDNTLGGLDEKEKAIVMDLLLYDDSRIAHKRTNNGFDGH